MQCTGLTSSYNGQQSQSEYCLYNGALLLNLLLNTSFIAEHITGNTAADKNRPNNSLKFWTNCEKKIQIK